MIAFLDAGVLVALYLGVADRQYAGVVAALAAAQNNGWILITSRFAVMEAVGVIRRRITEDHRYRSGSDREREEVDKIVRGAINDFLDLVGSMKDQSILRVVEIEGRLPNPAAVHAKMMEHAGYTVPGRTGRICRYRGIGIFDWVHIMFARAARADAICTTDKAFADVAGNDAEFGHIMMQLTNVGPIGPLYGPSGNGRAE